MLFCPKCGYRNKTTYNFCRKCGTKIKFSIEDLKSTRKEPIEYQINKFITLKLENGKTVIYVKDEKFLQCKYLLIEILKEHIRDFDVFTSIDDLSENLDHSLEKDLTINKIQPEVEFWGHCSNLQAWSENSYDTNLLHSNLAFPLLKKLTDVGDPIARRVFKDEIAERLMNLHTNVTQYLIRENYLEYFNKEEIELLMEILFEQIEQRFKKKQGLLLEEIEINALLDIIKVNLLYSKIFLIERLKSIENINKETNLGFLLKDNRIFGLALKQCGLKMLPSSIGNFKNLEELHLMENQLNYLPNSIGNLTKLKKLDLSDNYLIELPDEIGNLKSLKELLINHNLIQNLPGSISSLKNLEILSLWGNQIKKMPKNLDKMNSLRVLGLSFNHLEEFPELLCTIPNLEILDLSNNKIKALPENFHYYKSLKTLWLNNNPINKIPESMLELESLKDLYIVNTMISIKKDIESSHVLNILETKGINIWK
ncbi:MAG: leucine-rich repeat domain-containing protein [Candidatus Hodarchaeota archaeon]